MGYHIIATYIFFGDTRRLNYNGEENTFFFFEGMERKTLVGMFFFLIVFLDARKSTFKFSVWFLYDAVLNIYNLYCQCLGT